MNDATNVQFVVLIVVFSLATYLLAFSLERALVQFKGKSWPVDLSSRKRTIVKGDVEAIPLEPWPMGRNGS